MNKFNVGDVIVMTNSGYTYGLYFEMAEHIIKKFEINESLFDNFCDGFRYVVHNSSFRILGYDYHLLRKNEGIVYLLYNIENGDLILSGDKYFKKINQKSRLVIKNE